MITWVIERLVGLVTPMMDLKREHRELADSALKAISKALNETYLYYEGIEQGGQRNREIEAKLYQYWSEAAIPMRHIDVELAEICEHKSEYWLNPDHWDHTQTDRLGIGLADVRDRYRALLVTT
jgi:hypothetical protein